MSRRTSLFVLVAGTSLISSCVPIPARHSEQVTPAIVGTLLLDDGTPAGHYLIAATDEMKDRTCSRPGGRGVSDSLGRFQLAATSEERKVFWFTLMENFGLRDYWVCARPAALGAPGGARVSDGARTVVEGHFSGDSLDCLRWRWRDTIRLSCNVLPSEKPMIDRNWKQIFRGGSWTEGDRSGSYRVLLVPIEDWQAEAHAVVQWVDGTASTPNAVRMQMDLPTRDSVMIWGGTLDHVGDAWRVRVLSARKTFWGNDIWLTFELGPPGQLREIREK